MRTHRNFPGLMVNIPKMMDQVLKDGFTTNMNEMIKDFNTPAYNVKENDNQFIVELSVPGFEKEDFSIKIHEGKLTVSAEVEALTEDETKEFNYREFTKSTFSKTFRLPKGKVEEDAIEASYKNGILSIVLAKKEEAKPKAPQLVEIK